MLYACACVCMSIREAVGAPIGAVVVIEAAVDTGADITGVVTGPVVAPDAPAAVVVIVAGAPDATIGAVVVPISGKGWIPAGADITRCGIVLFKSL